MAVDTDRAAPRATYRLQFNKDFGFDDAAALAPYLARLGVSHVYASPYLRARPGSTHGYDIVSHTELNPEIGSAEAFGRMVAAFKSNGLGQILDFVPNHMGVGGSDNPLWLDTLEWGEDSEFSGWFDIDWETDRQYLRHKLLVPFLGDHYGNVLQSGGLMLKFDPEEGSLAVWAYDTHKLPICPLHYGQVLGDKHPKLEGLSDAFAHLPTFGPHIRRCAEDLKAELSQLAQHDPEVASAIQKAIDRFNGAEGTLSSWSRLDALIQNQNWRAAHFRVAADDINYRRFFNINDLAGIRIELPEVFDHAHSLIFTLLEDGVLDGIRLDHIDGLLTPKAYCLRLREKAPRLPYLVVEKILAPHESLRMDWGVDGTTGYEFANLITHLLIDPAGELPLTRFYEEFTGERTPFAEIARTCKLGIMENEMASELNVLAREAAKVARSNARTADFTDNVLRRALQQIIACFPVYRTYVDGETIKDEDRRDIDWAFAQARRVDTSLDRSVFDFLYQLLTCDLVAEPRSGFSHTAVARVAMRAQQYSGPVMAKGVEDTAFYRYNRFLALNEVGGQPEQFSTSLTSFHHTNADRAKRLPHAMLSTSTHDTKRGEDARARLAALSECAEEWSQRVTGWSRLLRAGSSGNTQDTPPDRNDEYAFYQLLLCSWPMEFSAGILPEAAALETYRERIEGAMLKSMREAKVHSTWALPNTAYEDAVLDFIRHALDVSRTNPFLESFATFQARIAWLGMQNSLVQTTLKLTLPGMPDIYQGAEFWDLSLVDPDNRRAVDFEARRKSLSAVAATTSATALDRLLENWHDGGIKLWLTERLLRARAEEPALFDQSNYVGLNAHGPAHERICAFVRQTNGVTLLVAVALFPNRPQEWAGNEIPLPAGTEHIVWRNLLDQQEVKPTEGSFAAAHLFAKLPVAILLGKA
jgi:(1->4)-alpha-D-glucan 1-alpha-D-glucosylmutase